MYHHHKFVSRLCILMGWLLLSTQMNAQEYYELMNDPKASLGQVNKAADQYFSTHSKGKSSGYKPYKRWEHEQRMRRNSKGQVLNQKEVLDVLKNKKSRNANSRLALPDQPVYQELGPRSNNTSPTYGGGTGMGRLNCVEVDPNNKAIIYVAGVGGVWKSMDAGYSWRPLTDNYAYSALSVAVDPNNSNILLAGFSDLGIYKSLDAGNTWAATSLNSGNVLKIQYHPSTPNLVFVANTTGLFRSDNNGDSYAQLINDQIFDIEFKPTDLTTIYASGVNFYRSANGGSSFTQITSGVPVSGRTFIGVTPANPNYVYMIQEMDNRLGYVLRSSNSGISFTTRLTANETDGSIGYMGAQAWHNMTIAVSLTNAEELLMGGVPLWKSSNGGTSFTQAAAGGRDESLPYVHFDFQYLERESDGTLYAGTDGGVYRSTDNAVTWQDLSSGIGNREVTKIGGIESDPYYIGVGSQDNGQSLLLKKGLHEWRDWSGGDGMEVVIDYNNKNIVYGGNQAGGISKTVNNGLSSVWYNKSGAFWVTPMFLDPVNPTIVYLGEDHELAKSVDGATTWTKISNFNSGQPLVTATIARSNNQYIYASDGNLIWVTKNGGTSWQSIRTTTIVGSVNDISVHPSNANKLTLITNAGVFKSDNAGTSWQDVTYDLPDVGKVCILYQNSPQDIIYAGIWSGVYYLKPGTSNWVEYNNGLPNIPVFDMEINYTIGMLRVGTRGRGLWEVPIVTDGTTNALPIVKITSPAPQGSIFNAPASITLQANATDADGTISSVKFYNGTTLLGSDLSAPYSYSLSALPAGSYLFSAQAIDNTGAVASSKEIIVLVSQPVCSFNNPKLTGTVIGSPGSWDGVSTKEKVYDGDISNYFDGNVDVVWSGLNLGKTVKITGIAYYPRPGLPDRMLGGRFQGSNVADFSSGVVTLATVSAIPPETWTCLPITNTSSFAYVRYICDVGGHGNVAEVVFYGEEVTSPANTLPSASITAPVNNASFTANSTITINANASDANGTIARVEFYDGNNFLGTDLSTPYSFSWSGAAVGNHSLKAKAIDNNGAATLSSSITITVTPSTANTAPGVSLSVPSSQKLFNHIVPVSLDFTATANDVDGTISKVEFYFGTTLIHTDLTAPYTYTLNNVGAGYHYFTAKATDNAGAETTSIPLRIFFKEPSCPITDPKVEGQVIGTPGSYLELGSTREKAFDNDINTYFDAPVDIAWTGLNLGKDIKVSSIYFYPRIGAASRMIGGKFEGSSSADFTTGVIELASITSEPATEWNCVTITNPSTFRYLRYICGPGGVGNVAEIRFHGAEVISNPAPTVSITSPANNATFTAPASITINATAADANGTVSNVQFYYGTTLIGSDATAPYSITWPSVAVGTYSITARATDNQGAVTTSTAISVTVNNAPPTVSITSPANNATFATAPASITINATAADANGTVSNVQFYYGTTLIGSDATAPYTITWPNVAAGTYSITARATDNHGAVTTSTAISVTVGNTPPTVSITSPANNATFATAPASITINATAADANGTVSNVQFYYGTTLIGSDATSPYSITWPNVAAGTYSITARATDNLGAVTTSTAISVTVGNTPPTVSITSPANNTTFTTAPVSISINATAADANGTVSNVQFYNGTTLIGSDATSPYTITWPSVGVGTYSITAKATDNLGAVTTSTAVSVTVTSGGGNCVNKPIPDATKWVVRNNWNDQNAGSGVANTTEALQVTHRAYGNSYLWIGESGTAFTVTSGKTYKITFDYKDHANIALSAMQVGFASNVGTGGDPTMLFPAVTVPSGYSNATYTTKSVNISATTGGTAYLSFKLNWTGQPNQTVVDLFKNISICEVASGRLANYLQSDEETIYPNPAKNEVTLKLNIEEEAQIELLDARGTLVRTFKTSTKENTISLENISTGLYLIRIREGSQEKVYRLIKE